MAPFDVVPTMLRPDGFSLTMAASEAFAIFLAGQIADLMSYFAARRDRNTGEVTIDENSNETLVSTPPPPPLDTPGTSNSMSSWALPDDYETPNADVNRPKSGVILYHI